MNLSSSDSPLSSLVKTTTEEMLVTNDANFFNSLDQDLGRNSQNSCFNKVIERNVIRGNESEIIRPISDMTLEPGSSRQKILPFETCLQRNQRSVDSENLLDIEDCPDWCYNHSSSADERLCFYFRRFTINECLHEMDKEYENMNISHSITRIPVSSEQPLPPIYPRDKLQLAYDSLREEPEYTICQLVDEVTPPNLIPDEGIHFIGNSLKSRRRLDVYRDFLKTLKISDFPFSREQKQAISKLVKEDRFLYRLHKQTEKNIVNDFREKELEFKSSLDSFMDLFADTCYDPVSSTVINKSVLKMINELEFWIEKDHMIQIIYPGKIPFFVDPATYLISKLNETFPEATDEKMGADFFRRRKESHVRLADILSQSKYPFTSDQRNDIHDISAMVVHTNGNPDTGEEEIFVNLLGGLIFHLTLEDNGSPIGISNPKKVVREFERLINNLIDLGKEDDVFLEEFERNSINPANLINNFLNRLRFKFIPRIVLSQEGIPDDRPLSEFWNRLHFSLSKSSQ